MKSRTSFFNSTVLRKDFTRFAPVWALYLVGGLLVALNLIGFIPSRTARNLMQLLPLCAAINLIYALINAQLLFGDLFNSKLCNALHAMPIRREGWFFTHSIAGLSFSLLPNTVLAVFMMLFMGELWFVGILWLLAVTMQYLFFFGTATFSAVCAGHRFSTVTLYFLLNFGAYILWWIINTFYDPLLNGVIIDDTPFLWFAPAPQLIGQLGNFVIFTPYQGASGTLYRFAGLSANWWYLLFVALLGAGFSALALLLYRKRQLERAGDFLVFRWLEPAITLLLTFCTGAFFQLLFEHIFFLIVGCAIGFFVTQMMLQRRVNVFRKRTFVSLAILLCAVVLSLALTALDPLGITRWTPGQEKVQSVTIAGYYGFDPDSGYYNNTLTVEDPEQVQELIDIHKQLTQEGYKDPSGYPYFSHTQPRDSVTLVYKLKNGQTVVRSYYYDKNSAISRGLEKFLSAAGYIMGYNNWEDFLATAQKVTVNSTVVDASLVQGLLCAVREDCDAGTIRREDYGNIELYVEYFYRGYYRSIPIHANARNTMEYIQKHQLG